MNKGSKDFIAAYALFTAGVIFTLSIKERAYYKAAENITIITSFIVITLTIIYLWLKKTTKKYDELEKEVISILKRIPKEEANTFGISKHISRRLPTAQIYITLFSLESKGLVIKSEVEESNRTRLFFELTEKGKSI